MTTALLVSRVTHNTLTNTLGSTRSDCLIILERWTSFIHTLRMNSTTKRSRFSGVPCEGSWIGSLVNDFLKLRISLDDKIFIETSSFLFECYSSLTRCYFLVIAIIASSIPDIHSAYRPKRYFINEGRRTRTTSQVEGHSHHPHFHLTHIDKHRDPIHPAVAPPLHSFTDISVMCTADTTSTQQ